MKKLLTTLLVLAMVAGLAACGSGSKNNSGAPAGESSAGTSEPGEDGEIPEEVEPEGEESPSSIVFTDDNVTLMVVPAAESFKGFIDLDVTLTNHSDEMIIVPYGSGSNSVPSDLKIGLDDFVALHLPGIMTMDYQTVSIEPGESVEYTYTFAPYRSNEEFPILDREEERDLDYFAQGDFTPVEPGQYTVTVDLSYYIRSDFEDPSILIPVEGMVPHTVEGEFTIILAE